MITGGRREGRVQAVCVTLQEFLAKQLLLTKDNLPKNSTDASSPLEGQAGLVKRIWAGEPRAPARSDVVEVSLENALNSSVFRLHAIENKFLFRNQIILVFCCLGHIS